MINKNYKKFSRSYTNSNSKLIVKMILGVHKLFISLSTSGALLSDTNHYSYVNRIKRIWRKWKLLSICTIYLWNSQ